MTNSIKIITDTFEYCKKTEYQGWDPYDGLNSKVFDYLPIKTSKFFKMAWIQLFKHSPINFRKLLLVEVGENPKGLSLVLSSLCNFSTYLTESKQQSVNGWHQSDIISEIRYLVCRLKELRSPGYKHFCWGYNFPWQSKAFYLPRWCPTVVATSFVVDSLLRAYDLLGDDELIEIAESSSRFVIEDLNLLTSNNANGFSYSPLDDRLVYNATLLGSRLLANVYKYNNDDNLKIFAKSSIESTLLAFNDDGSIDHSVQVGKSWRDSFHTGFKLESLIRYQNYCQDHDYDLLIKNGKQYWLNNFFDDNGLCHYFDNKTYPLDIHCPGQFFASLYYLDDRFEHSCLADNVFNWMVKTFYLSDKKMFIFQKKNNYEITIPYMRWGQCWALYGLSFYQLYVEKRNNGS